MNEKLDAGKTPEIVVVGASNIDLVSVASRLPKLGETLPGKDFQIGFGGKGANQAVMAAKLGGEVMMITKLGDDVFGKDILRNYQSLGFDTRHVTFTSESHTGVAPIWVDESSGDNAIIVAIGANAFLSVADVQAAKEQIESASVVVCQWESPIETSIEALRVGDAAGAITLLNPAPAQAELPSEAYAFSKILCVNESEAEILSGISVDSIDSAKDAGKTLRSRGAGEVIVTLGEHGCVRVDGESSEYFESEKVAAVDTTGAGDCFVGCLAYFLSCGKSLRAAIPLANKIAGMSVQKIGTQTSYPDRGEIGLLA